MPPSTTTSFWKQFKPKSCSLALKASTKEEALQEIVDNLVAGGCLPADLGAAAVRALAERERLGSTGVGMNVAIPHVKLPGIERVACSLSVHAEGIEWSAVDGEPVNLIFTVLRPDAASETHDPQRHLDMMHWIARLGRDGDFRRFAQRVTTKAELIDLLKEMSSI
jgi:mannitol/fructose-specific phosphotransferase system IIA component (Ntr-type)